MLWCFASSVLLILCFHLKASIMDKFVPLVPTAERVSPPRGTASITTPTTPLAIPTCLDRAPADCEGSFRFVKGIPHTASTPLAAFYGKEDLDIPLPFSLDPLSQQSVDTCLAEWKQVRTSNAGNNQLPKSSHAEDITIFAAHFSKSLFGSTGVFLEMGAFDGVAESNSRFFERCLGWRGLLIEANPKTYAQLVSTNVRPTADKLHLAPSCSTDSQTIMMTPTKYTNAQEMPSLKTSVPVHCGPLKSYLEQLKYKHVHFFSLDVEGAELSVIKQVDFKSTTIDVIMIESVNSSNNPGGNSTQNFQIRSFLEGKGYEVYENVVPRSDVFVRKGFH